MSVVRSMSTEHDARTDKAELKARLNTARCFLHHPNPRGLLLLDGMVGWSNEA
jgi:hypothetical protein